jgi:hypothetical protein
MTTIKMTLNQIMQTDIWQRSDDPTRVTMIAPIVEPMGISERDIEKVMASGMWDRYDDITRIEMILAAKNW